MNITDNTLLADSIKGLAELIVRHKKSHPFLGMRMHQRQYTSCSVVARND
jgi:hypothetical protein